jgi:hypothetical protein
MCVLYESGVTALDSEWQLSYFESQLSSIFLAALRALVLGQRIALSVSPLV